MTFWLQYPLTEFGNWCIWLSRRRPGTTSTNPGLDSMHGIAARSHPFGEMPVHAMAKAAAFLPLEIF